MSFFTAVAKLGFQMAKGGAKATPKTVPDTSLQRLIQQIEPLPETPRRVLGKELDEWTGSHSDFVSPKRKEGLESLDEIVEDYVPFTKVDETQDIFTALGRKKYPELNKNPKEQIKKIKEDVVKFKKPKKPGTAGQRLSEKEQNVYKNPDLEKAATKLNNNEITFDEFKEIRDTLKPLKVYSEKGPSVPTLYDDFDILASMDGGKVERTGIVGVNKNIKQGTEVTSRFDINAYTKFGRYVVTIQDQFKKLFGYAPTAILKNVKFAGHIPPTKESALTVGEKSFKIAQGGGKGPFAVMEGKWQDVSPESTQRYALNLMKKGKVNKAGETHKEWTEIGFDPSAKLSFYNRSTGEPIFKADKVVQVGGMLLARGIQQPSKEQIKQITIKTLKGKQTGTYKQGGQVSEGLSSIVSRAKGGNLSFEDKMYEHAMRILNKETLNPSYYHTDIRDERGLLDPVNFVVGTAFEDEEDQSDKFYYMEAMKAAKRDSKEAEKRWNIAKSFDFDSDSDPKDNWRVIGRDPFKDTGYKVVQDEQGREWSELDGAAIDTTSGLKHGGQTMAGGLSGIKKTININGQPHSLAWINPDEASVLKAMGGSGKKVEGVPAYYYDDPGSMQPYLDVADETAVLDPITEEKAIASDVATQYLTDDGGITTDRSEATGLTSPVTFMNLEEADLTSEEGAGLGKMYRQYIQDKIKQLREGREGEGREYEKALALEAIHAEIPGSTDPWFDIEKIADKWPWLAPGAAGAKFLGWLSSLDKNPVMSQVNMGGKIYDIRMDGTMTERKEEIREDENEPIKKKKLLPPPVASVEPEEKELTGMEKYYAELPKTTPRKDSNVHLSALLDQIYGEGQGQSMLG